MGQSTPALGEQLSPGSAAPKALILNDQEFVLELTSLYLKRRGHETIQCITVQAAFEQFKQFADRVDLVIANVSLPDGSGIRAGFDLWQAKPALKILFMSGHRLDAWKPEDAALFKMLPQQSARILQKPFSGRELLDNIRELIGEAPQTHTGPATVNGPHDEKAHHELVITALERQAELLELAHDAILVRDTHGTIRYWNRGAESLYGWNRDYAIGRLSHQLLGTIFPVPLHEIQRALRVFGRWQGELRQTTRDRNMVTVSSRWAVRKGLDGQIEILEINRDITAQKEIEEGFRTLNQELGRRVDELSRSEERFRCLVESAPDAMVIVTVTGEIALVNAQTEALFGYTRDELIGKSVEILMPEEFRACHEMHRHNFAKNPRSRRMGSGLILTAQRKNGEPFSVEVALSLLNPSGVLLIGTSIREIFR